MMTIDFTYCQISGSLDIQMHLDWQFVLGLHIRMIVFGEGGNLLKPQSGSAAATEEGNAMEQTWSLSTQVT